MLRGLTGLPNASGAQPLVKDNKLREATLASDTALKHAEEGRYDLALSAYQRARKLYVEALGERHERSILSLIFVGSTYVKLGRFEEGLSALQDAAKVSPQVLGEDHVVTTVARGGLARALLDSGRPDRALPLFEGVFASRIKSLGERHPLTILVLENIAEARRELNEHDTAVRSYEKALKLRAETFGEGHPQTLSKMTEFGFYLFRLGRYEEATRQTRKAHGLQLRVLGAMHPDTLRSQSNMVEIFISQGHADEALLWAEDVLKRRTQLLGETHFDTLVSMGILAVIFDELGRLREGLALKERVLRLQEQVLGIKHGATLRTMGNVAYSYSNLGRLADSLALNEKVLKLSAEVFGEKHQQTITAMVNLAENYRELGRPREALVILEDAARLSVETLGEKHPFTLTVRHQLALSHVEIGQMSKGLVISEAVLKAKSEVLGTIHRDTLNSLDTVVTLYGKLGLHSEALPVQETLVRSLSESYGSTDDKVLSYTLGLADTYLALGRKEESLSLVERVTKIRTESLGVSHPSTLRAIGRLAATYKSLGRRTQMVAAYEELVTGVEQLRASGQLSPEDRQTLLAIWVPAYKIYARELLEDGRLPDAFRVSELSKARTLLESSAARHANQSGILTKDEQALVQRLEEQISSLTNRLAAASGEPSRKLALEAEKNRLVREIARLRADYATKYPKYARLTEARIRDHGDGKSILPRDAVLISYLLVGDTPLVFVVDHEAPLFAKILDPIPQLARTVNAYRMLIGHPLGGPGLEADGEEVWRLKDGSYTTLSAAFYKSEDDASRYVPGIRRDMFAREGGTRVSDAAEIGRYLGARLLDPILSQIREKRHWIIAPDDALAILPFEALVVRDNPVILQHDVSYTQSLSMFALLQERDRELRKTPPRRDLFAMGGAVYQAGQTGFSISRQSNAAQGKGTKINIDAFVKRNAADVNAIRRAFELLNKRWPNLPGTEKEVESVAKLFERSRVTVLMRQDVTEARLQELNKKGELAEYRFLLFSAHAYLSTEEPMLSSLVLGQLNNAPGTDGYITAAEWPTYDLRSELIVLSACETGVGNVILGEGIMGLPYALYVAGNKSTLLSLWPILDDSTAEFMTIFFGRLRQGVDPVRALSETKRDFILGKRYQKPAFWAAFLLYGT